MSTEEYPAFEWCYNGNMMFNPQMIQTFPVFKSLRDATTGGGQFTASRYDNDPLCWLQVYAYQWINKQYAQGIFLTAIYGTLFFFIFLYIYAWSWPEIIRLVGAPLAADYTRYNVQ